MKSFINKSLDNKGKNIYGYLIINLKNKIQSSSLFKIKIDQIDIDNIKESKRLVGKGKLILKFN